MVDETECKAATGTMRVLLRLTRSTGSEIRLSEYQSDKGRRNVLIQYMRPENGTLTPQHQVNLSLSELAPLACALVKRACEGDIGGSRWKDPES